MSCLRLARPTLVGLSVGAERCTFHDIIVEDHVEGNQRDGHDSQAGKNQAPTRFPVLRHITKQPGRHSPHLIFPQDNNRQEHFIPHTDKVDDGNRGDRPLGYRHGDSQKRTEAYIRQSTPRLQAPKERS